MAVGFALAPLITSINSHRGTAEVPSDTSAAGQYTNDTLRLSLERGVLQESSKLSAHLPRVARNLTDRLAFEQHVIARSVEEDPHTSPRANGGDHPRTPDLS